MSIKLMSKVWSLDLEARFQIVLLCLTDFSDDYGGNVYPSVSLVAWKIGYSVRQTQRIMGELRAMGALILEAEASGKKTRRYRINLDALPEKPPFEGTPKDCSKELREEVIQRHEFTCFWCHQTGDETKSWNGKPWEIDRLNPEKRGGKYETDNVVLSCSGCNKSRGARLSGVPKYLERGAIAETQRGAIAAPYNPSENHQKEPSEAHAFFSLDEDDQRKQRTAQGMEERFPFFIHFGKHAEAQLLRTEGFGEAWRGYVADRKERRKALTSRSAGMVLATLSKRPGEAIRALSLAIEKQWQGFKWDWFDNADRKTISVNSNDAPKAPPKMYDAAAARQARRASQQ